jgi:hypothetical protein
MKRNPKLGDHVKFLAGSFKTDTGTITGYLVTSDTLPGNSVRVSPDWIIEVIPDDVIE